MVSLRLKYVLLIGVKDSLSEAVLSFNCKKTIVENQ
jgi:hypothetical protein